MKRDRNALRMRALELIGRCGLSYQQAGDALGVSRNVIAGFDMRAKRRPSSRRYFVHRPTMTFGSARAFA